MRVDDVNDQEWLAERFEEFRNRLRAVAYRMLGSITEADDAVQETWLRLSRTESDGIENLEAWLTTVVGRVCLNTLRARANRREASFDQVHVPEPIVDPADGTDPEHEALIADSVGLAMLVVLESLNPTERLAFVLHDVFGVPYQDIAPILDRSPEATRQLASRARHRVRSERTVPDGTISGQRRVVEAFQAAARDGDFESLIELLDPNVVLRADGGLTGVSRHVRGAYAVAGLARGYALLHLDLKPALINGAPGVVAIRDGQPFAVLGCTVSDGRIVAIDILSDPERLAALDLSRLHLVSAENPERQHE
jgi:RNA polymerase sigma-70 factor (ECF subfamily)